MTEGLDRWSSARHLIAMADALPGHGSTDVQRWLASQEARVKDEDFAALFGDLHERFGVHPLAFAHRILVARGFRLLAGIRFFGQDPTRPFIELLAWDGPAGPDAPMIRGAIAREWAAFRPRAVRVFHPAGMDMSADASVDMTVHAASYEAMARLPTPLGAALAPMTDPEPAVRLVAERYRDLAADDPALARDMQPIGEGALRERVSEGRVLGIERDGYLVGLLATGPGTVDWIRGDVVEEEVVARKAAGGCLAAAAQSDLARRRRLEAARTLLLGTILGANVASRRTALRAGRPEVARYSFLPLAARP